MVYNMKIQLVLNIYYSVDDISYDLLHEDKDPSPTGIIGSIFDQDSFLDTSDLLVDSAYGTPDTGQEIRLIVYPEPIFNVN